MNEAKKEQLSAFMDGELDDLKKHQVEQMLKDPALLSAWSRYHLVSDCLRGSLPEHLDQGLAGRVAKSLEKEPAIVAPGRFAHSFAKPVAGFAIAASVAALAIFGIQQQQLGGPHEIPQEPLAQTSAVSGNIHAPVRQVSSGSGKIIRECEGQSAASRPGPDNRQPPVGNTAEDGEVEVNCP